MTQGCFLVAAMVGAVAMIAAATATAAPMKSSAPHQPGTATQPGATQAAPERLALRIATFNIEDVRTDDLLDPGQPRVRAIAQIIQRLRPNIILLNEIAYDMPGAPGVADGAEPGQNAQRFVDNFLARPQVEGVEPIRYRVYMAPTNTGMPSGFDLDNDGQTITAFPTPPGAHADGTPGDQTEGGRLYGNDCWGFGTFPGQYAMALLVDERLEILRGEARTFRLLPWDYMPNNRMPDDPATGEAWYDEAEARVVRLSSKSHWDVPVRLPNGAVLHVLCSHPTPPAFDGPERRNVRRNHDEVRFWADYVEDASYVVDDAGRAGGLPGRTNFVILGDQNLDPDDPHDIGNAMRDIVLASPRVNAAFTPRSDVPIARERGEIDPTDTAFWGKRADYVIPSATLEVIGGGIWRHTPTGAARFPSDHFPVWLDVGVGRP